MAKKDIFEKSEKSDYDKLMEIFKYVIKTHNVRLNVPTIKKIYEIDNTFDYNLFDMKSEKTNVLQKIPIEILYNPFPNSRGWSNTNKPIEKIPMSLMNTNNCYSISVHYVLSYKVEDNAESLTDINEFIKNIDKITSFVCAEYDWKTGQKIDEREYQVKYLKSKTKTIRFVLHSCTKKAHNVNKQNSHRELQDYYIDGNPVKKEVWLMHSREYKLKRVVNE